MNEIHAPAKPDEKQLVDHALRRWERAKMERAAWISLWQEMSRYVRPSSDPVLRGASVQNQTPNLLAFESLFDSTMIESNMTLAGGCLAELTPAQTPWFKFGAPGFNPPDRVKEWFNQCTEIAHLALATSNFYTEIHTFYLERGGFGTACLHCDAGKNHPLNFTTEDMGSFALADGVDRRADTIFRDKLYDARQAAQEFGESNLPEEVKKQLDPTQTGNNEKHEFLHVIYPREDAERDGAKIDARNMPVASLHIHVKSRTIVRNSGYSELSSFGSRYLRWGTSVYGFCPAWQALPDARQLNDLQRNLDVLAEVAAFPRMLLPSDMEGEVDLRANGATYFKDPQKMPKEWLTQGRYDIGQDRVAMRRKSIEKAFHVELFNQWGEITKQMTAAEVSQRALEKIKLFSPTFTLLTTELYTPLLRRVFSLLLRQGCFPPPPPEAVYMNAAGRYAVPDPQIQFTSRLALALKSVRGYALQNAIARAGQMSGFPAGSAVGDNLDWDKAFRDSALDDGMPVEWLTDEEDVSKRRSARAEQQAQMQQEASAHQIADSAAKLAGSGLIPTQKPQQ